MSKILASMAAFALLTAFALPAANAAERGADGVRPNDPAAMTEFSSHRRHFRHGYWGHRRHFVRHHWRPRHAYWRPRHAYYRPYPYWRHRYVSYRPWYGSYGY